jgi:formate hydrogenlyase subunit 4
MNAGGLDVLGRCALNVGIALLLAPLFEGIQRKLRALVHSRIGPPVIQPYLDLFKLLGKEDLRAQSGAVALVAPALALGSALVLAMLVPMGAPPPLGGMGDVIVLIYLASLSAVLVILAAFGSGSPYAFVGGSREMMLLLSVEPVMVVALIVAALKAGTLVTGDILGWHLGSGPAVSMVLAGLAFFLALQAQAGKLPFDIPEADQELMGGPFAEFSGPRLALLRWTLWTKQLVFAFLLVELFAPWPRVGLYPVDLLLALVKVLVVLLVVQVVDVVNPRLRVEQAMRYYLRVAFSAVAALAFAAIGM